MDTNRMKTRHSIEQIQKLVTGNPARLLESGDVVLPPARLSFPNLAKPGKNFNDPTKEGKYGANLLFTPGVDLQLAKQLRDRKLAESYPANPSGAGMKNVFKDQGQQVSAAEGGLNAMGKTYSGYVPGCVFFGAQSQRRPNLWVPPIVNGSPTAFLGDEAQIEAMFYPGCWVIAVINAYKSSVAQNPGVFFGLQSLFKVMDDNKFEGAAGSVDPKAAFGGVNIDSTVNPESLF